ncbi:RNA polymerase subunit sigma [Lysinibacillus sp. FSL R7-0073]|uniref:RNA polymerase subunit sigma n=1 Tax=Lysinibacillus fusiformis TaxID=28031 RepID=A0A1E4R454_9BACI|nr:MULTISPECIES: RNA polymerase subunit sigma [Lysinibacillus]HBJ00293.1 RNA polymerase subunit sigma [Lysinibacillus sp.]MBD8520027.1 RNA polymerase subunit sigma [Lysinibacillus fusiformis]MCR8851606.1 RNA polymerase subunit sigma [Lysinibacillus fusiformis]MED4887966.1 RNA polymerase subunit sigma [Lysinibacillus fusiformis]ODV55235.1 RNA polymerase subunit sigma [Lysinibacillus fusiformis]
MSLKGVELQIAIPKTFEAGKIADQVQQQALAQQAHANEALKKEIERKQKIVNTSEGMDEISEDEDAGGEYLTDTYKKKKKQQDQQEKQAQHPFKGNFVDFSG